MTDYPKWKQDRIDSLNESRKFFSNASKLEREKWVTARLVDMLEPHFNESQLSGAEEPGDVSYKDANFQIKEILDAKRRRGDEYKAAIQKVINAKDISELSEPYTPQDLSLQKIVDECCDLANNLSKKYGPKERAGIDLVIYHNRNEVNEVVSGPISHNAEGFRSISIVSNRFRLVVTANSDAPEMLKSNVGAVFDRLGATENAL